MKLRVPCISIGLTCQAMTRFSISFESVTLMWWNVEHSSFIPCWCQILSSSVKTLLELTSLVAWKPIYFAWPFDYLIWTKIGRNSFPSGTLGVLLELLMAALSCCRKWPTIVGFRLSRFTGLVAWESFLYKRSKREKEGKLSDGLLR